MAAGHLVSLSQAPRFLIKPTKIKMKYSKKSTGVVTSEESDNKAKLTTKEESFCLEFCVDWNATQAAIRAGYSKRTAKSIGCENLTKLDIQSKIEEIRSDLSKASEISALKIIREHAKIAFTDAGQFRSGWMELKEFESLTPAQKACIQEISTKVVKQNIGTNDEPVVVDVEYVKLKLYDKQKSLDSLSTMLGFNAPIKQDLNVNLTAKPMSKAEACKYLEDLKDE